MSSLLSTFFAIVCVLTTVAAVWAIVALDGYTEDAGADPVNAIPWGLGLLAVSAMSFVLARKFWR